MRVERVLNKYFSALQFVAYSLVAFPIVGIGIIGNLLSLLVLSRPNLKGELNIVFCLCQLNKGTKRVVLCSLLLICIHL